MLNTIQVNFVGFDEVAALVDEVGDYSTYFVDLGDEIQDEIIARTEHSAR